MRDLRRITFGSSVLSHGLKTRIRSRTARRKIEDRNTWYFLIDRGERPSACALVTQSWTTEGETLFSCRLPNAGQNCLFRYEFYAARVVSSRCLWEPD